MGEDSATWLTKTFLEKIVRTYKNDNSIIVDDFKVGSGFVQHFASDLFKCQINFTNNSKSEVLHVIIKSHPVDNELKKEVVSGGPFFQNEIRMYRKVFPALHKLFEKHGMKVDFEPELIYASEDPFPVIILKDLSIEGFFAPRKPFDDFEDTKVAIQRIAQLHAASFYLAENNEFDFTSFNYSFYENEKSANAFFKDSVEALIEVVSGWDECKQYLPNLEFVKNNVCPIALESSKINKPGQGFNVLNHVDFTNRNILVKMNEDDRLEKFLLIDFQICNYCSPAVDLAMVFCHSKQDENGDYRFEEVLMFYHQEFVKTLKAFGYQKTIPTLLDLNVEILRHGQLGMLYEIGYLPFVSDNWLGFNIEDLVGDGSEKCRNFKKSVYEKPIFKKFLQKRLKTWVQRGWI